MRWTADQGFMPRVHPHPRLGALLLACLALLLLSVPTTSVASTPSQRGVVIDVLYDEPISAALADVDSAAAIGSNVIRLSVRWDALQPTSATNYASWYLDALDQVVARAKSRNVKVVLTPVFTPCWASSAWFAPTYCAYGFSGYMNTPPANPATYANMVVYLAKRWAGTLAGVEVWNEPNLSGNWTSANPIGDYAKLVKATYPAVKAAAPSLPVSVGVTAGVDVDWLTKLRAQGIANAYDAISVHPYNDGRAPETLIYPAYAGATFLQGLQNLRTAMTNWKDTHPVWITEMGWNTSTQRGYYWLDGVSLADQAAYLSRALAMLADPKSGVDYPTTAIVYRLRDIANNPADPQSNYGLMAKDRTAKPSLNAVKTAFAALAAAR